MSFKRRVFFFINKFNFLSGIIKIAVKINLFLFHWNEREHLISYGTEDVDKMYYVIRSRGVTEGLLSSALFVFREIQWAKAKGYIPFVDFSNTLCQYYVDRLINGSDNAWEYYFIQPSKISKIEIQQKKNVLLSGWTFKSQKKDVILTKKDIVFQPYILNIVNSFWNKNFLDEKVLGIFIRGTDYVKLRPKNHAIQPSIEEMEMKISEYMDVYNFDKIYVVTEDFNYYSKLVSTFKDKVFSFGDDFIKDYDGTDYISASFKNDAYERNLNYLIRIILLSKCEYTICSKASGSSFARLIREKTAIDEYWFDLGVY